MNCCVPDLMLEGDGVILPSSFTRRIPDSAGEDFVELLWQKGRVYHMRTPEASPVGSAMPSRTEPCASSYSAATTMVATELFMEEDQMASWLDYPLGDEDGGGSVGGVGGDYLPNKTPAAAGVAALDRPFQVPEVDCRADVGGWAASGRPPPPPETEGNPALWNRAREPEAKAASVRPPVSRDRGGTRRLKPGFTSSSGVVCEGEGVGRAAPRPEDRKRKSREADDSDYLSEDAEFESSDKKERTMRSTSKRRSRAAEVHNLSERRRRDRINEKMKALQQLIPRCNKSDKASMLDDAIEYLRSLQMQVRMMSMGCNMVPMMFPGMQQCMPPMGMAIPMGMGIMGMGRMEMSAGTLNHPIMPFLPVMSSSHMVPTGAATLNPGMPMQPFHAQALAISEQMKLLATSPTDPAANLACLGAPRSAKIPSHTDPCQQQYAGFFFHPQVHLHPQPQNPAVAERGTSKGANMPEKSNAGRNETTAMGDASSFTQKICREGMH